MRKRMPVEIKPACTIADKKLPEAYFIPKNKLAMGSRINNTIARYFERLVTLVNSLESFTTNSISEIKDFFNSNKAIPIFSIQKKDQ